MARPSPRKISLATTLCLLLTFWWPAYAQVEPLTVLVPENDLARFQLFVGDRRVEDIHDYSGTHSNRETVELVLLHQALRLGGYTGPIALVPENNYSRLLRMLRQGKAQLTATTVWASDLAGEDELWVTDPVVRRGEFAVGVYVRPDNTTALQARQLADYAGLSAVSNRNWQVDWRTLEAMNVNHLYHINTMALMVKMIGAKRGDFMLAPFSARADLAIVEDGVHLVPVPDVKVVLNDSRHWVASRNHPLGEQAYKALQAGLQQLRDTGTVVRAYEQSGFFNPAVKHWHVINNSQTAPMSATNAQ